MIEEKNKILALKVSNLGLSPEEQRKAEKDLLENEEEAAKGPSRFTNLLRLIKNMKIV